MCVGQAEDLAACLDDMAAAAPRVVLLRVRSTLSPAADAALRAGFRVRARPARLDTGGCPVSESRMTDSASVTRGRRQTGRATQHTLRFVWQPRRASRCRTAEPWPRQLASIRRPPHAGGGRSVNLRLDSEGEGRRRRGRESF